VISPTPLKIGHTNLIPPIIDKNSSTIGIKLKNRKNSMTVKV
jgi:hypothetical protein